MSHTSASTTDEFTLKEKITYTILGIVVIGGSFLIGKSMIRRVKADNEERKTFEDGSAATYAKQIKMAFENDGWGGTDEQALRNVLSQSV